MIVPLLDGAPRAVAALRAGDAVVLPPPSPLPYGVTATSVAAVNRAKGRPEGQAAGIAVDDFDEVAPFLAVNRDIMRMIAWMCTAEQLNVFAPLRDGAPSWMVQDGAQTDGSVGLMGSWLPELRALLGTFGHLFVSSANPTQHSPAVTAREADESLGGRLLVVDGDAARDQDRHHSSATIAGCPATGGSPSRGQA
jgi:L-threonylcarbamoyladenylate synthase